MIFLSFLYIYKTSKPKNLHSLTATCEATSDKMVGQPNVPQIKELFKSRERWCGTFGTPTAHIRGENKSECQEEALTGSTSSKKTVSQVSTVKHMTVAKICELVCLTSLHVYYCLKLKGTLKNSGTWILKTSSLSSCRQKGVEDVRRIRCSITGSCCCEQIQSAVLKWNITHIKVFLLSWSVW